MDQTNTLPSPFSRQTSPIILDESPLQPSRLFQPLPIRVSHVKVPQSFSIQPTRSPTPFPMNSKMPPSSRLQTSNLRSPEMWVDATIKVEEGMEVDNSRSPVKTSILPLPTFTPETSEEGLPPERYVEPRTSVSQVTSQMATNSEPGLLSPTTTEPIEELMLPRQRRLPSPPVELRADRYREIKDQLVRGKRFRGRRGERQRARGYRPTDSLRASYSRDGKGANLLPFYRNKSTRAPKPTHLSQSFSELITRTQTWTFATISPEPRS